MTDDLLSMLSPEARARLRIDEMLQAAGWVLQDWGRVDFAAGDGVAVREFVTPEGPVDYLLVADGLIVGSVEAKAEGHTLLSVENQTDRYNAGFKAQVESSPDRLPRFADELLFQYVSTGVETNFQSRRDPIVRPRDVFSFHQPQTLARWAREERTFRTKLHALPPITPDGLRDIQFDALCQLERSLADDKQRALAAITMGGGKTLTAVAESYRLLRFGGAQRILFLVDRVSLADQAAGEFRNYAYPDGRRFDEDYVVDVLRSADAKPSANVVICTIQRLYALLTGNTELDDELDDVSSFDLPDTTPVEVSYNPAIPVEFFDLIFVDECHRSIYGRWGQVLDYFDAFTVGLTATPTPMTLGYFNGNVIAEYTQEQSVLDGINVDQQLFRIRTEVGETGSTIQAGDWVKVRDRLTRATHVEHVDEDYPYEPEKLDRAVVNPAQIRTVVRAFKDLATTQLFPERDEVPKTIYFCKNDHHAEDVLKVIREEFGGGTEFARKITYKAEGTVQENIQAFRTDPKLRIAVTVEQIGTGTDIKAVECLVFMRMVGSRVLFNQMRGRAVRTMNDDDFWQVTPGAAEKGQTKTYSVLVDAVGITDDDFVLKDAQPVTETKPSVPMRHLLQDIGMGTATSDTLKAVALRLRRLAGKLSAAEHTEFTHVTGGRAMTDIAQALLDAADEHQVLAEARTKAGIAEDDEPPEDAVAAARKTLADQAVAELRTVPVREKLDSLQAAVSDVLIHVSGTDRLIGAEYVESPDEATDIIATWRDYIEQHKDEHFALRAYFAQPYGKRPSLDDITELANAISRPPHNLTPERVWAAYERLEASKVKGHGGKLATDLVRLVRFTLQQDDELVPHEDAVKLRFDLWLDEQQQADRTFTDEQKHWLHMVRDRIITSMEFIADDYDYPPFSDEGGIYTAHELFGPDLGAVVAELNEVLAA